MAMSLGCFISLTIPNSPWKNVLLQTEKLNSNFGLSEADLVEMQVKSHTDLESLLPGPKAVYGQQYRG